MPLAVTVERLCITVFLPWIGVSRHQSRSSITRVSRFDPYPGMTWQPRDGAEFVVHHSMGEYNSADSFGR
jgi:hypothetical protein